MATTSITYTIDNSKIQKVIDTMKSLFPIPRVNGVNQFTDAEWAKEAIRRWVITQVARRDEAIAKTAISIRNDDTLVT